MPEEPQFCCMQNCTLDRSPKPHNFCLAEVTTRRHVSYICCQQHASRYLISYFLGGLRAIIEERVILLLSEHTVHVH
jgi:hypothetical protein